ncbi:mRNA interferase HigB [Prevotellaceae bacterium MN60]|nr:mRNA interferase HigB [Prevotellaceae bacterium MN60]
MRIISFKKIREFIEKDSESDVAMREWHKKTEDADWKNFADVKNTFNSVDNVGNDRYVFNVKGNHYRIVAMIIFAIRTVYLRFVGTHKEYDNIKDIQNI